MNEFPAYFGKFKKRDSTTYLKICWKFTPSQNERRLATTHV